MAEIKNYEIDQKRLYNFGIHGHMGKQVSSRSLASIMFT